MSDKDDELINKIKSGEKITKDDIYNDEGMVNLSEGTNSFYYELNEKKENENGKK